MTPPTGNDDDRHNKENKGGNKHKGDAIERKEFDKMLKSIYVKQSNFNSASGS